MDAGIIYAVTEVGAAGRNQEVVRSVERSESPGRTIYGAIY
jgi:hypothetical protein